MRDITAWIVFVVLQILFIPLAIIGILLSTYSQLVISKRLGVSGTAVNVASERLIMHRFGLREDRAIAQLLRELPNVSMLGGWLILLPWYLRYRISGKNAGFPAISSPGKETVASMVRDRTLVIDRIIQKSGAQVTQFVNLGAGFDTRCYGSLMNQKLQFFELDQPATQRLKKACLAKAGIDTSHVHFVEVDFSCGSWADQLTSAGFDPSQPTLFLWEGVTLYLSEGAVRRTLRAVKSVTAQGSVLVCDFYARSFVNAQYSTRGRAVATAAGMSGEGLGFGLDFSQDGTRSLADFLAGEGLTAGEAYFMGHTTKRGAFMVVVGINSNAWIP